MVESFFVFMFRCISIFYQLPSADSAGGEKGWWLRRVCWLGVGLRRHRSAAAGEQATGTECEKTEAAWLRHGAPFGDARA